MTSNSQKDRMMEILTTGMRLHRSCAPRLNFIIAVLLLLPVRSYGQIKHPCTTGPSLHDLLEGPGGPRKISETKAGQFTQVADERTRYFALAYAIVWAEKVEDRGVITKGVRITLFGIAADEKSRLPSDIMSFWLGADEVTDLIAAIRASETLPKIGSQMKDSQTYIRWASCDGLVFLSGTTTGLRQSNLSTTTANGPIVELTDQQLATMLTTLKVSTSPI